MRVVQFISSVRWSVHFPSGAAYLPLHPSWEKSYHCCEWRAYKVFLNSKYSIIERCVQNKKKKPKTQKGVKMQKRESIILLTFAIMNF